MKLEKAIQETKKELLEKYKEVVYLDSEIVYMTSNTTTSSYHSEKPKLNKTNVVHVKNRFKEIEDEIKAVEVTFHIKYPRKRKFIKHREYYKIIN